MTSKFDIRLRRRRKVGDDEIVRLFDSNRKPIDLSGGGGAKKAEVILDHATILQLSETPYEVIAPTEPDLNYESSASSLPIVISACYSVRVGAPYQNFNPDQTNSLFLCYGSDQSQDCAFAVETDQDVEFGWPKIVRADMRHVMSSIRTVHGTFFPMSDPNNLEYMDNGLYLKISTPGTPDPLTGGNSGDQFKITVWYEVVDIV